MDEKVRNLIIRYLGSEIELADFQQQFSLLYIQARRSGQSSRLCDEVVLPLAELSRGHRSEYDFRSRLQTISVEEFQSSSTDYVQQCSEVEIDANFQSASHPYAPTSSGAVYASVEEIEVDLGTPSKPIQESRISSSGFQQAALAAAL